MKKQCALLSAAGLALGLSVGMPAQAEPPPWAPAHGYRAKEMREYRYIYYPAQQVYYAPESQLWFWLNDGNWQFGVNLPTQYPMYAGSSGVSVMLHSDRPYVEHVYVEEHYGRPLREKHHHRDKDEHQEWHHEHGHGHHDD